MTLKINYPNNPIITRNLYIKKLSIKWVDKKMINIYHIILI